MRVLIIDSDHLLVDSLGSMMRDSGYCLDYAATGEEGLALYRLYEYDVIVLDIMVEDMRGLEVLLKLRTSGVKAPVVIASHKQEIALKIDALMTGADDYVAKPVHPGELIARLLAIVRRARGHASSLIQVGRLSIDLRRRLAEADGNVLQLTNKEYAILELLAIRKGGMISKEIFLNHLYGGMDEPEIKILDVFICRLRKKIAAVTGGDNFIHTVWGRGYMLEDPTESAVRSRMIEGVLKVG